MIRFEVSDLHSVSSYSNLTANPYIPTPGSTHWNDVTIPQFSVDIEGSSTMATYFRSVGYAPINGKHVYGPLRDKGVNHLSAKGTVQIPRSTFITSTSEHGIPQYYDPVALVTYQCSPISNWGTEAVTDRTVPAYEYTSGSYTYSVGASTGVYTTRYDGDKLIIIGEVDRGAVIRLSDGKVITAPGRLGSMRRFRRGTVDGSKRAYYVSNTTVSGRYFSGTEQLAFLAGTPNSGGALQPFMRYTVRGQGDSEALVNTLAGAIQGQLSSVTLNLEFHPADFGDLALQCSSQMKFVEENLLGLFVDVEDPRNFSSSLKELLNSAGWRRALAAYQQFLRGHGTKADLIALFQPGSKTYLFDKYVVKTSVGDIGRLLNGVKRSALFLERQRVHSRKVTSIDDPTATFAIHTAALTAEVATYPDTITGFVQRVIGETKRWGLYPEVQNLWDILPYSFVLDWFIQIGDFLEDINDVMTVDWYFPVHHCVMSEKWEVGRSITSIAPDYLATGEVHFSYYTRWISRELPLPTASLSTESLVGNHLLESTALVLQRIK